MSAGYDVPITGQTTEQILASRDERAAYTSPWMTREELVQAFAARLPVSVR